MHANACLVVPRVPIGPPPPSEHNPIAFVPRADWEANATTGVMEDQRGDDHAPGNGGGIPLVGGGLPGRALACTGTRKWMTQNQCVPPLPRSPPNQ